MLDDLNSDSLFGQEGNAHRDDSAELLDEVVKRSGSASVPAGVKPIWIGCVGGDSASVIVIDEDVDEADEDDCGDALELEPAMVKNLNMVGGGIAERAEDWLSRFASATKRRVMGGVCTGCE